MAAQMHVPARIEPEELARRIQRMPVASRLKIAAMLVTVGHPRLAEAIVRSAALSLEAQREAIQPRLTQGVH